MSLNSIKVDAHTGCVEIPQGGGGSFGVDFESTIDLDNVSAIFAISEQQERTSPDTFTVLEKTFTIQTVNTDQYECTVTLSSNDTRNIKPGKYFWDITINKNGENKYPIFSSMGNLPTFIVKEVTTIV